MLASAHRDPPPDNAQIGEDRPRGRGAERGDRAALIPGRLQSDRRLWQLQLVDPDRGTQLRPGELPVAGHEREDEASVVFLDHKRLDDVRRRYAEQLGGLRKRAGSRSRNDVDRDAAARGIRQHAFDTSRVWDNRHVTILAETAQRDLGQPDPGQRHQLQRDADAQQRTTPALKIGPIELAVPVVLAPMAGITNTAFRRLCREYGAGLYVSEMITSRALVERTPESMRLIRHHESETPRSIQLYGVDPKTVAEAVTMLVAEDRADHIDLNFGCPVPKVTRKGGGAALPWKRDLFRDIVERAVKAAGDVPLTVKMRKGIDSDHLTYLEAGRAASGAGVASIALHARTAAEFYSGTADWSAIEKLKSAISDTPILGNGDIWSAEDALRMVDETGCDGVVVGRGCLGRPWLFGDLAAAFAPVSLPTSTAVTSLRDASEPAGVGPGATLGAKIEPNLDFVARAFKRHAELLVEFFDDEDRACRDIRKHVAWYFKGYAVGGELRASLATVRDLAQLDELLAALDHDQPYPGADAEGQRGRAGSPKSPSLPQGWLDSRELQETHRDQLRDAELSVSGG